MSWEKICEWQGARLDLDASKMTQMHDGVLHGMADLRYLNAPGAATLYSSFNIYKDDMYAPQFNCSNALVFVIQTLLF